MRTVVTNMPLQIHTMPVTTSERHAEAEMEPESRPPQIELSVGVPASASWPAQLLGGEQVEDFSEPVENLPADEINVPVRHLSDDSPNSSPSSSNAELEEPAYQLPKRERHPPRRITYDQLGSPSCYSIQPQPQLLPFYPAPGRFPWLTPLQSYYFQLPCMYGRQQV
ncbi:Nance-Horan syndrome protein [Dissostichus eleginoides]|uniref:Nance-Horan syndrome protein n=1 Tax=Dissostichus eleginoides TaxID=100907 RepID=A0AAD9CH85_DISEL|nr:Nance-Horan syndrome protein [Dissostichus eleginoides]